MASSVSVIEAQIAALGTSDAAAVKKVSDAIDASTLTAAEKATAHAALAARVKAINEK